MLKINKKTEYALIALKHMALKESSELTSAREIVNIYQTPFDTTAKIMQTLNNSNILKSSQGVKGGYTLNRKLSQINFIELSELIEGKKFDFTCMGPKGICEQFSSCNIKTPLEAINIRIKDYFSQITLDELLFIKQDYQKLKASYEQRAK